MDGSAKRIKKWKAGIFVPSGVQTGVFSDEPRSYFKTLRSNQSSLFDVDFSEEKAFGQWCTDDECEDRQGIVISRGKHPDYSLYLNYDFRILAW